MDRFAINGRQVWSLILRNPDGKQYEEKIYGLDYSDRSVNLDYLRFNPEASSKLTSKFVPSEYLKNILRNLDELYRIKISTIIGPLGIFFLFLGIVYFYFEKSRYLIYLFLLFISLCLIGPLFYNVATRHILIVFPIFFALQGSGIVFLIQIISEKNALVPKYKTLVAICLCLITIFSASLPYKDIFLNKKPFSKLYNPQRTKKISKIILSHAKFKNIENLRIVSRTNPIPYYSGATFIKLPFTDLDGLIKYCRLNQSDYLILEKRMITKHPFTKEMDKLNQHHELKLLHYEIDDYNSPIYVFSTNFNNPYPK
jgi:hypothetical protein